MNNISQSSTILVAILSTTLLMVSCSKTQDSQAYQAACHGEPLRTLEQRNQAMEDGYLINEQFRCIDKASYMAVNEQEAKWRAANTPEAIAKRMRDLAKQREIDMQQRALEAEERARQDATEESRLAEAMQNIVIRDVDINTATADEIAEVISVGHEAATKIIEERNKRRFRDWADLVYRVNHFGSAKNALFASTCGLNVDGKSLEGAPPDARMAANIYATLEMQKKRRY